MGDASILRDFDLESVKMAKATLGAFDTMSLTAHYNHAYAEYQAGTVEFMLTGSVPEVMKTLFHETAHLYQMSSTPYGYYYSNLRAFQSNQLIAILKLLQEYGLRVKYPLVDYLMTLKPREKYEQLWSVLYCWYLAEMILLYYEGDPVIFSKQLRDNPLLDKEYMFQRILEMEHLLRDYFFATGRRFDYTEHHLTFTGKEVQQERALEVLKLTGSIDVMAVLESWAKVTEFWESPVAGADNYSFSSHHEADEIKYYFYLSYAQQQLGKVSLKEFMLSFSALAELALYTPILPQHCELRKGRSISIGDLNPAGRLIKALQAARKIEPIHDLEADYPRFIEEVCEETGWPTTMEICQSAQSSSSHFDQDLLSEFYFTAQNLRRRMPHAFIDMSVWYSPKTDVTAELTYYFAHPVIEFTDKILYHKNKDFVFYFASQYLLNRYLRKMLLSGDIAIPIPFRADKEMTENMRLALGSMLTATTGMRNPRIEFRQAGKENAGLMSRLLRR